MVCSSLSFSDAKNLIKVAFKVLHTNLYYRFKRSSSTGLVFL